MADLDRLLAASDGFLLGRWVADARAMAAGAGAPADADFLEWNARSQVPHVRIILILSGVHPGKSKVVSLVNEHIVNCNTHKAYTESFRV
jgi:hypothetical protein